MSPRYGGGGREMTVQSLGLGWKRARKRNRNRASRRSKERAAHSAIVTSAMYAAGFLTNRAGEDIPLGLIGNYKHDVHGRCLCKDGICVKSQAVKMAKPVSKPAEPGRIVVAASV